MNPDMCRNIMASNWMGEQPEGCANLILTRTDGRVIRVDNVVIDSVSPVNEDGVNRDVVGVELFDKDETLYFPFIERWTFEYN